MEPGDARTTSLKSPTSRSLASGSEILKLLQNYTITGLIDALSLVCSLRRFPPHGKILCLVEAKHHSARNPVAVGVVRQLYGTFCDYGATSAVLVTTSRFTSPASRFQKKHEYQLSLRDYAARNGV